jgi:arylsulfatase A-like enzyme
VNLSRRDFGRGLLATSALQTLGQSKKRQEGKKPNVLFLIADEWRAQSFGYTGDPNVMTSAFDQFAKESVSFDQMVSGLPVCCPTRASLLTGQYPLSHGVYINDVQLKPRVKTLGECFGDAGYKTGYIGKWHVYGSPDGQYGRREAFIPVDQHFGFEYWKVAECCHDYDKSFYYEGSDPTKKFWEGYDAEAQTEDACKFIQANAHSGTPYFLTLSWGPPHFPLGTAPEKYRKMFADKEIVLRPNVAPDQKDRAIEDLRGYYAHMAALNDCFKQLLSVIDSNGGRENTIVLFTSDHGDMMRSQGLMTKLYPWEESIRVPLLVRYPEKYGSLGHRTDALITTPDLMPTLLSLCDIPIPEGVQGTDFSRLSTSRRTVGPASTSFLNMPVPFATARQFGIGEYRGVRNLRYTYVRSIKGPWLLYDNKNDPYQMHNLIGAPEARSVQATLEKELDLWLKALNDEFLPSETYLVRDGFTNYMEPYIAVTYTRSPWNDWDSTLPAREFSVDSPITTLLKSPEARAIMEREIPQALALAQKRPGSMICIRQMQHTGLAISQAQIDAVDRELAKIPSAPRRPLIQRLY